MIKLMNEQQQNQQSSNKPGGSNKIMLLVGLLLGIAIISTIAFFVLLFRSTGDKDKVGTVEGAVAEKITEKEIAEMKEAIEKNENIRGNKNAPLKIVLYDDMECPYCGAFEGTNAQVIAMMKQKSPEWSPAMPGLIRDYIKEGKVSLVYKHFPLSFHKMATPAAEATECAGAQGKFWEMHDAIFDINGQELTLQKFEQMAKSMDLDMDKYAYCMDNHLAFDKIQKHMAEGKQQGVNGTPGSIIGDELVSGAVPYIDFKQVVDSKLE